MVPVKVIPAPSIEKPADVMDIDREASWIDEYVEYLTHDRLPADKDRAKRVKYHAEKYLILDGRLYKRGLSGPLLRCLTPTDADRVLSEIHDGVCGNHAAASHWLTKPFCKAISGLR